MLKRTLHLINRQLQANLDCLAELTLRPLQPKTFFPRSNSALNSHSIATIINDIIVNRRTKILELGSGFSTIILAEALRQLDHPAKFVSVDENSKWLEIITSALESNATQDYVNLVHAPLNHLTPYSNSNWYSENGISTALSVLQSPDLIIIDGPSAYDPSTRDARCPSLHILRRHLNDNFSVYLDDAHRKGESNAIGTWQRTFGLKFEKINYVLAACFHGPHFNPVA